MNSRKTVELREAFAWTCDECGRDNFETAIHLESLDSDKELIDQTLRETLGLNEFEEIPPEYKGEFLAVPVNVSCRYCEEEYETIVQGTTDEM